MTRQSRRPKLLAIGPELDQSSYARVLHGILGCLAKTWDIDQLAVNYRGAPQLCEAGGCWNVLPNRSLGDRFGIAQAPELIARLAPDVVFIFNCFTVLPRYCSVLAHLGTARPRIVAYSPLLGEPVDANKLKGLAFYDALIAVSPGVAAYFHAALKHFHQATEIERVPQIAAIPHGICFTRFYELNTFERRAAKRRVFPEFSEVDDFAQNFIVLRGVAD